MEDGAKLLAGEFAASRRRIAQRAQGLLSRSPGPYSPLSDAEDGAGIATNASTMGGANSVAGIQRDDSLTLVPAADGPHPEDPPPIWSTPGGAAAADGRCVGLALERAPALRDLQAVERGALCSRLVRYHYLDAEEIITEGGTDTAMFFLESGRAVAEVEGQEVQNYSEPGDFFGEVSMLTGQPRTATVRAVGAASLLQLSQQAYKELSAQGYRVLSPRVVARRQDDYRPNSLVRRFFNERTELSSRDDVLEAMRHITRHSGSPPLTDAQLDAGYRMMRDHCGSDSVTPVAVQRWYESRKSDSEIDLQSDDDMCSLFDCYARYDDEEPYMDRYGAERMIVRVARIARIPPLSRAQVRQQRQILDANNDGQISFGEFRKWWERCKWKPDVEGILQSDREQLGFLFELYDANGSATAKLDERLLDVAEMWELVKYLNSTAGLRPMSRESVELAFEKIPKHYEEYCNFEEFLQWWKDGTKWRQPTKDGIQRCDLEQLKTVFMFGTLQTDERQEEELDKPRAFEAVRYLTDLTELHPLSNYDLKVTFAEIDEDKSGTVDFDEFVRWWKSGGSGGLQSIPTIEGIKRGVKSDLHQIFKRFDDDGNGDLDTKEAQGLVRYLWQMMDLPALSRSELAQECRKMDADGKDGVDISEFCKWWWHTLQSSTVSGRVAQASAEMHLKREQVKAWFDTIASVNVYKDTGSGQVKSLRSDVKPGQLSRLQTFSLLRQVMQLQLLEPLDDEELERVYAEMDIDNDGTVSFDEFFAWWKDNRSRLQGMSLQHGNRKLLWSAFQTFDEDSTGQIGVEDFDELVDAVSRQADILPLEAQEVQAMWNSKTILFEDFCNWWDRAKKIASTTDAKSKDSRFEKRLADIQKSNIPGSTVLVGIVNSVRTALRQLWKNARRAIGSFSHMIIKTAQIHEWSVQAWKFLTEEVPTTKHVTAAQGGKIFVLQFLAFLFPPLIFWAAVRKDYYMPVAARVDEFVKRMFWIVSMVALFTMHYNGVALNVTRSEVDGPIVMYLFLALMESAEEASLISSADQENSWKRQRLFSKFFLKCFPEKHHDDDDDSDEDESIAQPRNSAQKKRRKTRATQESGSNTLRLRDLDSARVREVRYDTFHRRELQNKHSTLLKHDPTYFFEIILRLHQDRKRRSRVSDLEHCVRDMQYPKSADPHQSEKRRKYEELLVRLKREDLEVKELNDDFSPEDAQLKKLLQEFDMKTKEVEDMRRRPARTQHLQAGYTRLDPGHPTAPLGTIEEDEDEEDADAEDQSDDVSDTRAEVKAIEAKTHWCHRLETSTQREHEEQVANIEDDLEVLTKSLIAKLDRSMMRSRSTRQPDQRAELLQRDKSSAATTVSESVLSDPVTRVTEDNIEVSARIIAQAIERLSEATAQHYLAACSYICIATAVLHALAPLCHWRIFGCVEESQFKCGDVPSRIARAHVLHTLQHDGQTCYIIQSLSCEATRLDLWMHVVSAVTSCGIFYSIAIRMARGYAQYLKRLHFMKYFSEITPWPTMKTEKRFAHFGLVPSFDLTCSQNIISWNRIRLYLLTYRSDEFIKQQLSLSCILFVALVVLVVQLIAMIGDSDVPLYDNLIKKEVVSTGLTMILLDQLLILFGLAAILLVGVRTTAMQTNMLRYVLLMKKGQLYDHHHQNHGSMFFSNNCALEITVRSDAKLKNLQQYLEDMAGVPAQRQQISIEGTHYYHRNDDGIAKLHQAELEKLLKGASFNISQAEYLSNELRAANGNELPKKTARVFKERRLILEDKKKRAAGSDTRLPHSTRRSNTAEWTRDDVAALAFFKKQLPRSQAPSKQASITNSARGVQSSSQVDDTYADISLQHMFTRFGKRNTHFKVDDEYMKLIVQIKDGQDILLERATLSRDVIMEHSLAASGTINGIVKTVRKANVSEMSRPEIDSCIEMLRGLAEILEEERLVNAGLVSTLEDVRCRLQLAPGLTVALTREFAMSIVSLLAGGIYFSANMLYGQLHDRSS